MSPNVLLNLARLYSRTATVVLFPESLNALSHLDSAMLKYAHVRTPALLTSLPDLRFPMPSYTPLLLPQDHAFWCSERSFFVYSRALDWNECIWKVWLEERGRLGHLNVSTTSTLPDPIVRVFSRPFAVLIAAAGKVARPGQDTYSSHRSLSLGDV